MYSVDNNDWTSLTNIFLQVKVTRAIKKPLAKKSTTLIGYQERYGGCAASYLWVYRQSKGVCLSV